MPYHLMDHSYFSTKQTKLQYEESLAQHGATCLMDVKSEFLSYELLVDNLLKSEKSQTEEYNITGDDGLNTNEINQTETSSANIKLNIPTKKLEPVEHKVLPIGIEVLNDVTLTEEEMEEVLKEVNMSLQTTNEISNANPELMKTQLPKNTVFRCEVCNIMFSNMETYKDHFWLFCPLCEFVFEDMKNYKIHIASSHASAKLPPKRRCAILSETVSSTAEAEVEENLESHVTVKCGVCNETFFNKQLYLHHFRYICPQCQLAFQLPDEYEYHIFSIHKSRNLKPIRECAFMVERLETTSHIAPVVSTRFPNSKVQKNVTQESKVKKISSQQSQISSENKSDSTQGVATNIRSAATRKYITIDKNTTENAKSRSLIAFKCKICSVVFSTKDAYESHRWLTCSLCQTGFNDIRRFKKHAETHGVPTLKPVGRCISGEKALKSVEEIIKASNSFSLKNAEADKTLPIISETLVPATSLNKDTKCSVCGVQFASLKALTSHFWYTCPQCRLSYKDVYECKKHILLSHKLTTLQPISECVTTKKSLELPVKKYNYVASKPKPESLKLKDCKKQFRGRWTNLDHLWYICPLCKFHCEKVEEYTEHNKLKHASSNVIPERKCVSLSKNIPTETEKNISVKLRDCLAEDEEAKCETCDIWFPNAKAYIDHFWCVCSICQSAFENVDEFEQHAVTSHKESNLVPLRKCILEKSENTVTAKCDVCCFIFPNMEEYENHLWFICPECEFAYEGSEEFQTHAALTHDSTNLTPKRECVIDGEGVQTASKAGGMSPQDETFKCNVCDVSFSSPMTYKDHLWFICPECQFVFEDLEEYKKHALLIHEATDLTPTQECVNAYETFKSTTTDVKEDKKVTVKVPKLNVTPCEEKICTVCKVSFFSEEAYDNHFWFVCSLCQMAFEDEEYYQKHVVASHKKEHLIAERECIVDIDRLHATDID